MSRDKRPVYLNSDKSCTAADLKSVAACDRWIGYLTKQIERIVAMGDPAPRARSALVYKRRALYQVRVRRDDLTKTILAT